MKRIRALIFIFLFALYPLQNIFAISEAAVLFLLISPSPQANGMGNTFMGLSNDNAMGTIYNPAQLGIFAFDNRLSVNFYPTRVQWLPALTSDIYYDCRAINLGFKLSQHIYAGIGYSKIYLDLGEFVTIVVR